MANDPLTGTAGAAFTMTSLPRLVWAILVCALFAAIAFGIHQGGLHSPMIYDSKGVIADSEHIFATLDPVEVMRIHPGRPVFMLSLYANYRLFGMDASWFRVCNVILLAGAGVALAWLILVVLEIPTLHVPTSAVHKRMVSLAMGLLFVVHPLQTFVVLYVWQRAAMMACLFYFASLGVYLGARSGRFVNHTRAYVAVGALFLAAMLSKENPAGFPLVLLIAELTLLGQSVGEAVKRVPRIILVTLPPLLVFVLCVHALHAPASDTPPSVMERMHEYYQMSGQTPIQVVLTQCRIFPEYLRMVVAPFAGPIELIRAETISTSLWDPPGTLIRCAGTLVMIVAGLVLIRRAPVVSFGLLFFVAALLPESVFMPKYIFFAYRPILSMAGPLLILGWAAVRLLRDAGLPLRVTAAAVLVLVSCGLGLQTIDQARKWNPITFWTDAYEKLPVYAPTVEKVAYLDVLVNFTGFLNRPGMDVKPADVLRKVDPTASADGFEQGTDRLVEVFEGFAPRVAKVLVNLGNGLMSSGDLEGAARLYQKAVKVDPGLAQAYANLGLVLDQQGERYRAMEQFRQAVRANPSFPDAHFMIGNSLFTSGDTSQAVASYQEALRLRPNFPAVRTNLGIALIRQGRFSEAVPHLEKAVSALPNDPEVHHALGVALAKTGNIPDAIRHFQKALDIRPDHAVAKKNLDALQGIRP